MFSITKRFGKMSEIFNSQIKKIYSNLFLKDGDKNQNILEDLTTCAELE